MWIGIFGRNTVNVKTFHWASYHHFSFACTLTSFKAFHTLDILLLRGLLGHRTESLLCFVCRLKTGFFSVGEKWILLCWLGFLLPTALCFCRDSSLFGMVLYYPFLCLRPSNSVKVCSLILGCFSSSLPRARQILLQIPNCVPPNAFSSCRRDAHKQHFSGFLIYPTKYLHTRRLRVKLSLLSLSF